MVLLQAPVTKNASLLHQLPGPLKVSAFLLLTLLFSALPLSYSYLLVVLVLLLLEVARLSPVQLLWRHRFLYSFVPIAFFIRFVLFEGPTLIARVTPALQNALYLYALFSLSLLLVYTLSLKQLRDALAFYRLPRPLSLMLLLAVQALPLLQENVQKTRIAQAVRGSRKRNPLPLLLPLLHGLFRRAQKLAFSLESRGFSTE